MGMKNSIYAAAILILLAPILLSGSSFASAAEVDWRAEGWRLTGGAVALSLAMLYTLKLLYGSRAALRFMASTAAISWLAETLCLHGRWLVDVPYGYNPDVGPFLPGGVPLYIPLAWFMFAGIPVMLLRGIATVRPDGKRDNARLAQKSAVSAVGMVAYDLALDPIAVSHGLWSWEQPGSYYGIPLMNFANWWVVSLIVFGAGYGWMGMDRPVGRPVPIRYDLAWGGANLLALAMLGCAASNRIGCIQPVLLAIAVLSPLGIFWIARVYREIKSCRPIHTPI